MHHNAQTIQTIEALIRLARGPSTPPAPYRGPLNKSGRTPCTFLKD